MRQNNGLADGQPEPVAGHLRLFRALLAEEWLEDALAILSRDAWPLIVDAELQFGIVGDPGRGSDRSTWRRVLDRVLDEIREHALHLACIHAYGRQTRWYVPPHYSSSKHAADPVQRTIQNGRRIGQRGAGLRRDASAARAGCQERVHELREPIRFQVDLRYELLARRVIPLDVGST